MAEWDSVMWRSRTLIWVALACAGFALVGATLLGWLSPGFAQLRGETIEETPLVSVAGTPEHFSLLRGKPAVIYFWASWCGPCHVTLAGLRHLPADAALSKRFVAVALDDNIPAVRAAQKRTGYVGPSWIATGGMPLIQRKFAGNDQRAVPYVIELDANGRIIDRRYGVDSAEQLLTVLESRGHLSLAHAADGD